MDIFFIGLFFKIIVFFSGVIWGVGSQRVFGQNYAAMLASNQRTGFESFQWVHFVKDVPDSDFRPAIAVGGG